MDITFTAYPVRADDMKLAQSDPLSYVQTHALVDFGPRLHWDDPDTRPLTASDRRWVDEQIWTSFTGCGRRVDLHPDRAVLRLDRDWYDLDEFFRRAELPESHPARTFLRRGSRSTRQVLCDCYFATYTAKQVRELNRALRGISPDQIAEHRPTGSNDGRFGPSAGVPVHPLDVAAVSAALERTTLFVRSAAEADHGLVTRVG